MSAFRISLSLQMCYLQLKIARQICLFPGIVCSVIVQTTISTGDCCNIQVWNLTSQINRSRTHVQWASFLLSFLHVYYFVALLSDAHIENLQLPWGPSQREWVHCIITYRLRAVSLSVQGQSSENNTRARERRLPRGNATSSWGDVRLNLRVAFSRRRPLSRVLPCFSCSTIPERKDRLLLV